jgi:hypothetical protein
MPGRSYDDCVSDEALAQLKYLPFSSANKILPLFRCRQISHSPLHFDAVLELHHDTDANMACSEYDYAPRSHCHFGQYWDYLSSCAGLDWTWSDLDVLEFCTWLVDLQHLG